MKQLKVSIIEFIKDVTYVLPVIITALLSFGFVITHYSVNIDSLEYQRYYGIGNELLAQGRFGSVLCSKIIRIFEFNPFFNDCLAVILIILSSIIFCALFKKITKDRINKNVYTVFSCLFISYPLINEIFLYISLSIGIGYLLVAISLYIIYSNKKTINYVITSFIMCITIAIYESFAAVYLCGIFIILMLEYIYKEREKNKTYIKNGFKMLLPLICAVLLSKIISLMIINIFNIQKSIYAAQNIQYTELGFFNGIKNLYQTVLLDYIINGLFYFPIAILILAILVLIIITIIKAINYKKIIIVFIVLGMMCSVFSLSIIQGEAAPYRTCQVFALFVAFVFMLLLQLMYDAKIKDVYKNIIKIGLVALIFYQTVNTHNIFYLNYLKYQEEKISIINIANEVQNKCDTSKPVVFIGNYELSDNIKAKTCIKSTDLRVRVAKKIGNIFNVEDMDKYYLDAEYIEKPMQTVVNSYINWGITSFGEVNTSLLNWLKMLGYDFKQGNNEMVNEAYQIMIDAPHYPHSGYIRETEKFIIVNM